MKYMRVGCKPDIFRTDGTVIIASAEVPSDVSIAVGDVIFHLHKFPILSKCCGLQRLDSDDVICIDDIPGGAEAFCICAKFCYGITVTLNAHNVISVRCAAEYLGMSESMERGNFIFKLEVFLNSCIFKSWKDSIICSKTTQALMPWCEDLNMVRRCIDAITARTLGDPAKVEWSFSYTRPPNARRPICASCKMSQWKGAAQNKRHGFVPNDWWVEDISELDIDMFAEVISAIQSKGRMCPHLIGEALMVYSGRRLPELLTDANPCSSQSSVVRGEARVLVEMIVKLMPVDKGSCSCRFMLRLLVAARQMDIDTICEEELVTLIGLQLDEASLSDLIYASSRRSYEDGTVHDVDMVQKLVEIFMSQSEGNSWCVSNRFSSPEEVKQQCISAVVADFTEGEVCQGLADASLLHVVRLVDGYLAEIAHDSRLSLTKFMALAKLMPNNARPLHDGLYKAIDIYMKEHPDLSKSDKARLCGLLNCERLSTDARIHAVQNDCLPLRVVVQLLFLEQIRRASTSALSIGTIVNESRIAHDMIHPQEHPHEDSATYVQPLKPECTVQATMKAEEMGRFVTCTRQPHESQCHVMEPTVSSLRHALGVPVQEKVNAAMMKLNGSLPVDLQAIKHPKVRALLANSRKLFRRLLSARSGTTSTTSTSGEISKSPGSSVSSVQDNNNKALSSIGPRRNSVS